ncbi:MAG: MobA/MobL family protein [Cetobacterium sp.]
MANYHLNMSFGKVGKTIAHFNYITATEKYTGKEKEVTHQMHNMPNWVNTPREFWQLADGSERVNGRTYREIRISLPEELSLKENKELLNKFLNENFNKHYYSVVIHEKEASSYNDKHNNIHAHIMFSPRIIDDIERNKNNFFKRANSKFPERGGAKKDEIWNKVETLLAIRKKWENVQNNSLEKNNLNIRVSCESLAKQRQHALESKDINKYDSLNRNPVFISSQNFNKKNRNEEEIKEFEEFLLNRKIKHIKDEIFIEQLNESKKLINENIDKYNKTINKLESNNAYSKAINIQNKIEQNNLKIKTLELLNIDESVYKKLNPNYDKIMENINTLLSTDKPLTNIELNQINDCFESIQNIKNSIQNDVFAKEKENIQTNLKNNVNKLKETNNTLNQEFNDIYNNNYKNKDFVNNIETYYNNLNHKENLLNSIVLSRIEFNSICKKIDKIDLQISNSYETTMNILSKKQYVPLTHEIDKLKNKIIELETLGKDNLKIKPLSDLLETKKQELKEMESIYLKDMDKFTRIKLSFEEKLKKNKDELLLTKESLTISLRNSKADLDISNHDIRNNIKKVITENKNIISVNSLKQERLQYIKNNLNKNIETIESIAYLSLTKGKYSLLQKDFKSTLKKIEDLDIKIIKLSDNKLKNMFLIRKLENEKNQLTKTASILSKEFKTLKESISDKSLFDEILKINNALNNASNKINQEIKITQYNTNELNSINFEAYSLFKDYKVQTNLEKFKNKQENIFKNKQEQNYSTGHWNIKVEEKDFAINL